ncbi:MAG: EVE domain-containing protein [Candidatus Gracilibacteria bacterium]|nr:EVE domain-containing protein [Candidatus Gracilibacteria bacterium]
MQYWLFKSEPGCWSWDDQKAKGQEGEPWDGVRNYQARNNMMKMKKGDLGFFYHSQKQRLIVGVVEIIKEHYLDYTAEGDDRWQMVDIKAVADLKKPVNLREIKEHPDLETMSLVKQGRLSVGAVTKKEFQTILKLGDTNI